MRVSCDSCILIYYLDHTGPWHVRASHRLGQLALTDGFVASSDLVRLEYRVQPLKVGDLLKLAEFDAYFWLPDVFHTPITSLVFDRATTLRARYNFKLADSIHLAAAIEARCDSFLTNDGRLTASSDIPIEVLP